MRHIRKNIEIKNTPRERVFDYINTPANLLTVWPSLTEISNVERSPEGRQSYDWVYRMVGLPFKGHSATVEMMEPRLLVVRNEGGIPEHVPLDLREGRSRHTHRGRHRVRGAGTGGRQARRGGGREAERARGPDLAREPEGHAGDVFFAECGDSQASANVGIAVTMSELCAVSSSSSSVSRLPRPSRNRDLRGLLRWATPQE